MTRVLATAGLRVCVDSELGWVGRLLEEACAGELHEGDSSGGDVEVRVEATGAAFHDPTWEVVTRGVLRRQDTLVLLDACSTGFDLAARPEGETLRVRARWRPSGRNRILQHALASRFHLLCRAVLLQYPALWEAGRRGAVPLHVSALRVRGADVVLAGPGGCGKSTLVAAELAAGAAAASDNLCVSDGTDVWGLVEPLRVTGGEGRRMPHGRREQPFPRRAARLTPSLVVMLGLHDGPVVVRDADPAVVARSMVAGTFMAGELRRYWPFAATLAYGCGLGPVVPDVVAVAAALTSRARCVEVLASRGSVRPLRDLLAGTIALGAAGARS